ncbi:MAG: CBS domain-containing protein [Nitrospiria bacterium]
MTEVNACSEGKNLMELTASHLMKREIISFDCHTSCHLIAETMVEDNFGGAPIVDHEARLIGIVTEYDLLKAMMNGRTLYETHANEIMTRPAVSIPDGMFVEEILALLQSRHLIRIPVVNTRGRLVGMVARRDILGCYIKMGIEGSVLL